MFGIENYQTRKKRKRKKKKKTEVFDEILTELHQINILFKKNDLEKCVKYYNICRIICGILENKDVTDVTIEIEKKGHTFQKE